ncbi:hypothetical protein EX895_004253 [Sporisorium graminicola]|uniref:JmjC domain-containing protein n=1 Tax=Sporisorium graminicola TaxID=280036 RepID=A0A4U7KQF2_9BASI|nr:hypothetical protein EX895_004253 [Sporisorium graminicola]TKY86614.1 hypothetical protein EX895_004253 [Sporisorium graminicola]
MPPRPPARRSRRSAVPNRDLLECKRELVDLRQVWEEMYCLEALYPFGHKVLDFIEEAIEAGGHNLRLPYEQDTLRTLFSVPPMPGHIFAKLLGNPDSVVFFDSNSLKRDKRLDLSSFWQSFSCRFDQRYKPLMASQTRLFQHAKGLVECGPVEPSTSLFPAFTLSSAAVFQKQEVSMCSEGVFLPPHMPHSSIGTLHTLVEFEQPFVAWPPTPNNLRLMERWHLKSLGSWDEALELARQLEQPSFNYLRDGGTIYLGAGYIWMTLSRFTVGVYRIKVANPAIAEWDSNLRAYKSTFDAVINRFPGESLGHLAAAVERLQIEHNLWKRVLGGLPQQRTADTVSRAEVKDFIDRQVDDLNLLKSLHDALQAGRDDDVGPLLLGYGLKEEETPEPSAPMFDDDEDSVYA